MNERRETPRANWSAITTRLRKGVLCSLAVLGAPAASTCGATEPDMTGTWATKIDVPGQLVLPIGTVSVNVQATLRMNVAASGSAFIHKLEMCALALPTNPDPTALAITFTED